MTHLCTFKQIILKKVKVMLLLENSAEFKVNVLLMYVLSFTILPLFFLDIHDTIQMYLFTEQ